ncbi:hypothetical protein GCM10023084_68740 [Streptomyces lacrimifluminis]|uniref:Uncharacterized protein n=1 Tax=Streptomyces lacrimifluminis TaxID=1500077 RepID=A0A917L6W3_9ACTN|nr:hypothetical protein GCM10012282_45400 [Streptomyces lacrimifluminis]
MGSVTTAAEPVTTTLRPEWVSASASKAATDPSTARTGSESADVRSSTAASSSRPKSTGRTAGRGRRAPGGRQERRADGPGHTEDRPRPEDDGRVLGVPAEPT